MNYQQLTDLINANIIPGVPKGITATKLKEILSEIADFANLTQGDYQGTAAPTTNPGSPTTPVYYFASTSGTYTNFGGLAVTAADGINILSFIPGTGWAKTVVPVNLANYLQLSSLNQKWIGSKNIYDPTKLLIGQFFNGLGNLVSQLNRDSVRGLPVNGSTTYTISGFSANPVKSLFFKDVNNATIGLLVSMNTSPFTFTTPSNCVRIDFNVRIDEAPGSYNQLQVEIGTVATSYQAPNMGISDINNNILMAKTLDLDNFVPFPINFFNAVNKKYVDDNFVNDQDILIVNGLNLFNPSRIVQNRLINSAGVIQNVTGWRYIAVPVQAGLTYTFGRINISIGGFYAWYSSETSGLISFAPNGPNQTITATAPAGANWLLIDISRPGDSPSVYSSGTVNQGSTLIPYEPYQEFIEEINGIPLKGSTSTPAPSFDQSLNTTNSVSFASVAAAAIQFDIPQGSGSPPVGVQVGDAWIDTAAGNTIKVRIV